MPKYILKIVKEEDDDVETGEINKTTYTREFSLTDAHSEIFDKFLLRLAVADGRFLRDAQYEFGTSKDGHHQGLFKFLLQPVLDKT